MGVLGQSIETPIIHVFASPDTSSLRHSVTPLIPPLRLSDPPATDFSFLYISAVFSMAYSLNFIPFLRDFADSPDKAVYVWSHCLNNLADRGIIEFCPLYSVLMPYSHSCIANLSYTDRNCRPRGFVRSSQCEVCRGQV